MQLIAEQNGQRIWLMQMQQSELFNSPCPKEEFAALIAVDDSNILDDNRNRIAGALVHQGCRYEVCMGYGCSIWDDALDWSSMETAPNFQPADENSVMTSWHEDETLEEVIFFFLKCTCFGNFIPHNFVVVVIGEGPASDIMTAVRLETEAFL